MAHATRPIEPDIFESEGIAPPRRFHRWLRGTYHHYSSILRRPLGPILRWFCLSIFGGYRFSDIDAESIRRAARRGPILYVMRDKSRLEYLWLSFVLERQNLPVPRFAHYISMYLFQSLSQTLRRLTAVAMHWLEYRSYPNPYRNGYVRELLKDDAPSLLCVSQFTGLPWRFSRDGTDPLAEILSEARQWHRPVQVVPVVMIYGRQPDQSVATLGDLLFGPTTHPGSLRLLWMALRYRNNVSLRVGEIDSLENMVNGVAPKMGLTGPRPSEELAYLLRREMIARLDAERRVVLGPIRKTRTEIVEDAMHNSGFVRYLEQYSKDTQQSFVDTRKRARRYLLEMAADYNLASIGVMRFFLGAWLRRRQGRLVVDQDGLEKVRRALRAKPLVYVPCHKSHLDYLLVSYVLYQHHLSLPSILAGINLDFWPVGGFFRNSGAFFLRRVFKGKRVYSRSVVAYVETLLREGQSLEFFIEGGRSRVGKIIPPKIGFLSILMDAFAGSGLDDIAFVPVLIDYERVFEEKTYLDEAGDRPAAGSKIQTALENRKMVRRRVGEVLLEFDDPLSLRELMTQMGADAIPGDRQGQKELAGRIAYRITWHINQRVKARPYSMLATVLLATPRKGILLETLLDNVRLLQELIQSRRIPIHGQVWRDTGWVRRTLDRAARSKTLRIENDDEVDEDTIIFVEEANRLPLTLHRNALVHHYQDVALLGSAFSAVGGPATEAALFDEFVFAKEMLAGELIYGPQPQQSEEQNRALFDGAMAYFQSKGFLTRSDQGPVPTAAGRQAAALFSSAVAAYLESIYVVSWILWKHGETPRSDKEWVKKAMKKGTVLVGIGDLSYPEAVHRTHFETALRRFCEMGYCRLEEKVGEKSRVTRQIAVADADRLEEAMFRIKRHISR